MRNFALVHNIPSPYRLHLFGLLNQQLAERGIHFHVHFMASGHKDRPHWELKSSNLPFSYSVWTDVGPHISGKAWHLNPTLLASLLKNPPDILMVGGPWDSLTCMLVSVICKSIIKIAWQEGNTITPGRISGVIAGLKRYILRRYDLFAVPGQEGAMHLKLLLPNISDKIVHLPNLVDESRFASVEVSADAGEIQGKLRNQLRLDKSRRLAIWPARLIHQKGILEFLFHLQEHDLQDWQILIIGEGPLHDQVMETISSSGLMGTVYLSSYFPYEQMPHLYQMADLFLLPSVRDPNPLSVVEAMHSGLPILISNRVGNFPEALKQNVNGWGFDPLDSSSAHEAIERAFSCSKLQLQEKGKESQKIATSFWSSNKAISHFLYCVLENLSSEQR